MSQNLSSDGRCRVQKFQFLMTFSVFVLWALHVSAAEQEEIIIGLSAEFGHKSSTSARAIEMGIETAVDEINQNGGLLDGRRLKLLLRDDRSIPSRGVKNFLEFSEMRNLIAVFGGKFSPVVIEMASVAERTRTILLDPWAAANGIVQNSSAGSFVFRLSLKDEWALDRMINHAREAGWQNLSLLVPNNEWGRSSLQSATSIIRHMPEMRITQTSWYNWGDGEVGHRYGALIDGGADAILMIANEWEGAEIAKMALSFPIAQRKPIISHWGIVGGNFVGLVGPAFEDLDLSVVQTFSFVAREDQKALDVFQRTQKLFGVSELSDIPAQVGFAHAYDLTHVLAQAIEQAGSLDREKVRDELENIYGYAGLVRYFERVFTPGNHEALSKEDVFLGRFNADGMVVPMVSERR